MVAHLGLVRRMIYRLFVTQVFAILLVILAACEEKHEFALGEHVRRKYADISGVIVRRTNYDGKGDVYYIRIDGRKFDEEYIDGPSRADELEHIP